jgi:hypothetical protein
MDEEDEVRMLPEHTSRIEEIKEIFSWKNALASLEPQAQKTFIVEKVLEGRMTESVGRQLIKIMMLEGE